MKVEIRLDPSRRQKDGLLTAFVRGSDPQEFALDLPFKGLSERFGPPEPLALDLLLVASLCYVTDKIVPRATASDNWTRELDVEFPVSSPRAWQGVSGDLAQALSFLTGDVWLLGFRELDAVPVFARPRPRRVIRRPLPQVRARLAASGVCLFSGGLDSLVGAVDHLVGDPASKLLLIGHHDSAGPASQQELLYSALKDRYAGRVELFRARVSHKPEKAPELTLRSRSLVFMALGLYAARALGEGTPVYAPENGVIAVNVPITPSRAGSCSTRTMHPFFLAQLRAVFRGLGFENEIVNPLQFRTKGECITGCLERELIASLAEASVSCSHGTRRQGWIRKRATNCGYCVPCLFRRAALHKAGMDDGARYGVDVCRGELPVEGIGKTGDDLRAVLDWVRRATSSAEIAREILAVAPVAESARHAGVVARGREEVRALILSKAGTALRRAAGISTQRLS